MIQDDDGLRIVREQIARLENALRGLALIVRPKSEKNFRIFAEGYVDQIDLLRREIDQYLGIEGFRESQREEQGSSMEPAVRK